MSSSTARKPSSEQIWGIVDKIGTKIAITNDKAVLQESLSTQLPQLLSLLSFPDTNVRNKVVEVLTHINKRVKTESDDIRLPFRSNKVLSSSWMNERAASHRSVLKKQATSVGSKKERPLLSAADSEFSSLSSQKKWKQKKDEKFNREFDREMLVSGNGVAFDVDRLNGRISGSNTVNLTITCFTNACGVYHDNLLLEVVGLPVVQLPIRVRVVGSPLTILPRTVGLKVKDPPNISVLQWISVIKSQSVSKTIYVANDSAHNLNIEWRRSAALSQFTIQPIATVVMSGCVSEHTIIFHSDQTGLFEELLDAVCSPIQSISTAIDPKTLSLSLAAQCIEPNLSMNCKQIYIVGSVTDSCDSSSFSKTMSLVNDFSFPLVFSIHPPQSNFFAIQAIEIINREESVQKTQIRKKVVDVKSLIQLSEREEVMLTVRFDPTLRILQPIPRPEAYDIFADEIELNFEGGHKQIIPIIAELHYPIISISPLILDFGNVKSLYYPVELPLYISNASKISRAKWKLVRSHSLFANGHIIERTASVFEFTEEKGLVSQTNRLKEGKCCIFVKFHAHGNEKYEQQFDIMVEGMTSLITVTCRGEGSFDEFQAAKPAIL